MIVRRGVSNATIRSAVMFIYLVCLRLPSKVHAVILRSGASNAAIRSDVIL